ncbi:MAG: PhoH family protein [Clostridia bacterium]|nr:PhoH family protein [Clostridia bacterium]
MAEKTIQLESIDTIISLFGNFDENAKLIEKELNIRMFNRDSMVKIEGEPHDVDRGEKTIRSLIQLILKGEPLTTQNILYTISLVEEGMAEQMKELSGDAICITSSGKLLKSKTLGQKKYITAIEKNTVTFGIGPAGTGKTYLAVAMAVKAFRNKEVNRIILTRPAVEAGEKLGFLPGDLQTKVDPYLRPLYDALYDMLGVENYQRYVERGSIEIAPLAYMRGRTLDDAFIILDEAQNTTPEQMKMFLTRIGFGSKAIVTGDITQIDLPWGKKSGLKEAIKILENVDDISFCRFSEKDVVRHPLVQKIIKAYEKYDTEKQKSTGRDQSFRDKIYTKAKEKENE